MYAYIKALDLLEKIKRYQGQNGLPTIEIPSLLTK